VRDLFTFGNVNHVNRQVCQFGAKGSARLSPPDSIKHSSARG
jgi:hypothetical protein